MKTICIKTNNQNSINYILNKINSTKTEEIKVSTRKFKVYNNIFIHYTGNKPTSFLGDISNILSSLIIKNYEPSIKKHFFLRKFFYFDNIEQNRIIKKIDENLYNNDSYSNRFLILFNIFYNFLSNEKTIYLKGFILFRLQSYRKILFDKIESITNEYIVEKEYNEFVALLSLYVNSEESKVDSVYLIYNNKEPILLDINKNPIKCDLNLTNAKFLSDISFSSADIVFNTLLNIIPNKIYIFLNNNKKDEFINTLELVFKNRVYFRTE